MLFTIACARTQKFLAYANFAILRTCYSLSIRKKFLTYVQRTIDRILFIKWAWSLKAAFVGKQMEK